MRECRQCGCVKDEDQFLPKRAYERERGILTKNCLDCRERNNRRRAVWYATNEQVRIGRAPISV